MFLYRILSLLALVATVAIAAPHGHREHHSIAKRGGGKRGVAFNTASVIPQFQSAQTSWAYNWGSTPNGAVPGLEYVPQLWGEKMFGTWNADANAAIAAGSGHLLGFNEPDHVDQASMTPAAAAAAFKQYLTPFNGRVRLGSPACTNSETPGMGLDWMRQFFAACAGQCGIDFMTTHWYAGADQVAYFKDHVSRAIATAKDNGIHHIWITEFAATGSPGQQQAFLDAVLPWLDSKPEVARYAYFYAAEGHMLTGNAVNGVGSRYIN
ncbi:hypothetical protein FQN54_007834 [Arachnomyces sp. PD_36]|nr:hypothetical protein FQN54_007834 [Arachnomyces sp. PD_36]